MVLSPLDIEEEESGIFEPKPAINGNLLENFYYLAKQNLTELRR